MIMVILKLLLTGAVAAMPPGPVAVLVLQKTLCCGRKGGLAASVGSGLVDMAYAALSLFAVGTIMNFIESHSAVIMLVGGILVAVIGFSMSRRNQSSPDRTSGSDAGSLALFPLQAALCALANPGALALMLGLVALFGISPATSGVPFPIMLLTVWCGEMLWWLLFTSVSYRIRQRISDSTIPAVCRIAGYVVIALGLVIAVRGIITLK